MQISILNQPLIKNKASLHLLITLTKPFFSPFGLNIFKLGLCPTVDYSDKSEVFCERYEQMERGFIFN